MNPAAIFKIKGAWDKFSKNHPRLIPFFNATGAKGIVEDTVIEIKISYPDGHEIATNMKLNQEDLDLFAQIKDLAR